VTLSAVPLLFLIEDGPGLAFTSPMLGTLDRFRVDELSAVADSCRRTELFVDDEGTRPTEDVCKGYEG
jgi:hypothetical protein